MKEVSEYRTVEGSSAKSLSEQINDLLQDGWQPFGGVSISYSVGQSSIVGRGIVSVPIWSQAVVRYKDIQPTAVIHIDENTSEQVFEEIREKLNEKNIT